MLCTVRPAERMHMRNTLLPRILILFITITGLAAATFAQSAGHTVTIQIADLTSEDRDGINRHLATRNDLRLVFACIPAGILVFETTDRESGALQELLRHHIPRDRAQFVPMDRESAENSCAQARN